MNLLISVLLSSSVAALLPGADLASYRNFRLDTQVADVAKQANVPVSDAKLVSSRPARIEEIDWHASWNPPPDAQSNASSNPFSEVLFRFYNGKLFEMTVTYDRNRTRGLTDRDMIEAISGVYGKPTETAGAEMNFANPARDASALQVIAAWADEHSQVTLVHLPYGSGFRPGHILPGHEGPGRRGPCRVEPPESCRRAAARTCFTGAATRRRTGCR